MSIRGIVFISHARPDEDELTRWLCGRLTARGYRVWADLEQLQGGEPFWGDIQRVIRENTVKFVTIMSRVSKTRDGVLAELTEAINVRKKLNDPRFIIPLRADDLPWDEFPIQINQLNGLDFSSDWMRNFGTLLKALEGVPRAEGNAEVQRNADLLVRGQQSLQRTPSEALFNRLSVLELPESIRYFSTSMSGKDLSAATPHLGLPCAAHDRLLVSFADLASLRSAVPQGMTIELDDRHELSLDDFLRGNARVGPDLTRDQAHKHLSAILRGAIERFLRQAGLVQFDQRWFVPKDWRPDSEGRFWREDGKGAYRVLVGKAKDLTWHFAVSFKVFTSNPVRIQIIPHVLFSPDGIKPLADQKQLRRQRCKLWWNDRWRDLLQAFLSELFGHRQTIGEIPLGGVSHMKVGASLVRLTLPVSYNSAKAYVPDTDEETGDWSDDEDLSGKQESAA